MTLFSRLSKIESRGRTIHVAIAGTGFVGRGLIHQLRLTPGMTASLVVSRKPNAGVDALVAAGWDRQQIIVSDDPDELTMAIDADRGAVTPEPWILGSLPTLDVMVEATGDVQHGALVALTALEAGMHVVSLNFETDATVGPLIAEYAKRRGLVYTGSDGDQPGVMMRLIRYVRGIGLDVVAAVNCKGFLDYHATPESVENWSRRQGTSPKMTTAFTDGTKMNVENCCVANATGLTPTRRGMVGVATTRDRAIEDFADVLDENGVVEYTLGGDFGSGVFVIASGADPQLAAPYLEYLKMGSGPWYLFFRPWHLVHFETPLSIAEAVLDGVPTIAPQGRPSCQVVAMAKRDLALDQTLGDIGDWDHYGLIDTMQRSEGLLPVGLAQGARSTKPIAIDTPIELDAVDLDETSPITRLWRAQAQIFEEPRPEHRAETAWLEIKESL